MQEFGSLTDPMVHNKRESLVHRYWQEENEHTKNRAFLSYRWIKRPKFNHVYVLFKHPNFCSRMLEMHSMRPTSRNKAINCSLSQEANKNPLHIKFYTETLERPDYKMKRSELEWSHHKTKRPLHKPKREMWRAMDTLHVLLNFKQLHCTTYSRLICAKI